MHSIVFSGSASSRVKNRLTERSIYKLNTIRDLQRLASVFYEFRSRRDVRSGRIATIPSPSQSLKVETFCQVICERGKKRKEATPPGRCDSNVPSLSASLTEIRNSNAGTLQESPCLLGGFNMARRSGMASSFYHFQRLDFR